MLKIKINNTTREGRLLGTAYLSTFAVETVEVPADIPVGTSVALLTPDGETLAHALVVASEASETGLAVKLDTNTAQSVEYVAKMHDSIGGRYNAFLAIGDTDNLRAMIPVLVVTNPLDPLAPPPPLAPSYPTAAALEALLAEMQAAATQTTADATQTAADREQTGKDRVATTAAKQQTAADRVQTGKDVVQTGLDKQATAADRVQTGKDVVQTGLDKQATAADRVQTGKDVIQTGEDCKATAADKTAIQKLKEEIEAKATEAETNAQHTATDRADAEQFRIQAGNDADRAEEALALVPAIALDTAALRDASFNLVGTDSETLVTLSDSL